MDLKNKNLPNLQLVEDAFKSQSPLMNKLKVRASRISLAFLLAGLAPGCNWFVQRKLAQADKLRQAEICQRVEKGTTTTRNPGFT
jgi:hypothetical protein